LRIFVSVEHLAMEHEMAHYLTSDGKYRGSPYADEGELSLRGYRFGRGRGKYRRGRSALIRANSYLKNLIHSIVPCVTAIETNSQGAPYGSTIALGRSSRSAFA
jgi:hypothetical protein